MDWVKGDQEDEERRIDDDIPVIPTKTMEEANSPGLFRRLFTTTEKPERVTRPKYLSSFISREQERKPDMTPIELEEWMTFYDEKYEEYLITPNKYNSPPIRLRSIMGSDQSIRQRAPTKNIELVNREIMERRFRKHIVIPVTERYKHQSKTGNGLCYRISGI